jgi:hypothetical protein
MAEELSGKRFRELALECQEEAKRARSAFKWVNGERPRLGGIRDGCTDSFPRRLRRVTQ